jgi:hypothetical protein
MGVHIAGELLARRTVLSKPNPPYQNILLMFSCQILFSLIKAMWDKWDTYTMYVSCAILDPYTECAFPFLETRHVLAI